jgi:hypothetical protein
MNVEQVSKGVSRKVYRSFKLFHFSTHPLGVILGSLHGR